MRSRGVVLTGAAVMGGLLFATLPIRSNGQQERAYLYLRTRPMRWLEGPQLPEA